MHITILFQVVTEQHPSAVTEVEGAVTDVILPGVGDTVTHRDFSGQTFRAQVLGRHFDYRLSDGEDVSGSVSVVLSLKRLPGPQMN